MRVAAVVAARNEAGRVGATVEAIRSIPGVDEVRSGAADLAIGLLPREPRHGGFRLVKRAAGEAIRRLSGFRAAEPLSGQRAITAAAPAAVRLGPRRLRVENWAGRTVPATLGWALLAGGTIGTWTAVLAGATSVVLAWAAAVLVFATGFLDDALGHHARGLRGHLASLLRGRPTTGVLKLMVGTALGIGLAVWLGGDAARVAPAALDRPTGPLLAAGLGAAVGILPFDLRERGMLGDAGSNPLGLLAGLGLAVVLPTAWLVVAAVAAVMLQVAAETDLDLGHYERFTDESLHRGSNVTTGSVYQTVIAEERRGGFLGKTVQVIPHITDEIKARIRGIAQASDADLVVVEIGGNGRGN